jgi:peptide/nickel transport system ATP-binding protein
MSLPDCARQPDPISAPTSGAQPLFEAVDLKCHFDVSAPWLNRVLERRPRQVVKAVDGVSFQVHRGETFALVGESGCGKSTIARLIVGLYRPTAGTLRYRGEDLSGAAGRSASGQRAARMQMIFQDPYASLNPSWRVGDIIAEPIHVLRLSASHTGVRERVHELLLQVGLSVSDAERYPHEFSGGQRQRISIARALAGEPEFLVCDEPTSALDVSIQAQILNLMRRLQKRYGLTLIFISHNLSVVRYMADRVGVMYLGRLCEVADTRTLFEQPSHPYTRLLLEAVPKLDMSTRERTPLVGEVPNPIDPPSGCAFHPRCGLANARCAAETPQLTAHAGGLVACHAASEGRLSALSPAALAVIHHRNTGASPSTPQESA